MGLLSRAWKVVTGVGGAVQAPFGLVKDLAVAPFKDDDEFDGFIHTLWGRSLARSGQALGNLFGPEEGVGAVVGGLPGAVRNDRVSGFFQGAAMGGLGGAAAGAPFAGVGAVPGAVIGAIGGGVYGGIRGQEGIGRDVETAYREGISRPVSTALTVGSLADAPGGGGISGLFDGSKWRLAYNISRDRSPGQALALAAGTKNINDEAEVARFVGTDAYSIVSGVSDALVRLTADPTVLAGKTAAALRAPRIIRSQDDIAAVLSSRKADDMLDAVERAGNAAEVRDRFFPDHQFGGLIATVLKEAPDRDARRSALRVMMGDNAELRDLYRTRADLAGQLDRLVGEQNTMNRLTRAGFELPRDLVAERDARIAAEVDALYPQQARLDRLDAVVGSMRSLPDARGFQNVRASVARSEWYQRSALAAPLRVAFTMRPQRFVNLHDQTGDVQVDRMLRQASVPMEERDRLRSAYMAALDPGQRQAVMSEAETVAIRTVAAKAGMTEDEIGTVVREARRRRGEAEKALRGRTFDGRGRSLVRFTDDDGTHHELHLPIWATQEVNVGVLPDIDELKRAASPIGRFRMRHPATDVPEELLDRFYRVWKPSVLLRVGWPVRVVGDEQLRIIAKIGVLAQGKNLLRGAKDYAVDMIDRVPRGERGLRWFDVNGNLLEGPFGAPGDAKNIYASLSSASGVWRGQITSTEQGLLARLRRETGNWRTVLPDEAGHGDAWVHVLNNQLGQDAMARKMLAGETDEAIVDWLRRDPDGRAYAARNRIRARNPERWVGVAREQLEDYTLGSDELKDLAMRRKVSPADLERLAPDPALRPPVNAHIVDDALGGGVIGRMLNGLVTQMFDKLGRLPTDTLSRNRFFDHLYRAEAERLVNLLDDGDLGTDAIARIQRAAREFALGETRSLLYDLAEESQLANVLRFVSPFFMAQQEVATRWAGLAAENPAFVARMRQVWDAPEKMGLVTDENGAIVHENGTATDPFSGQFVAPGAERLITVPIPTWAKNLPGLKGLATQGSVRFNKKSFNLALQMQDSLGLGPIVQLPVNEIVKQRPELAQSVSFILPYGATQDTMQLLMPAVAKRVSSRFGGEDDRSYRNAAMRIYFDKVVDFNLGKRDTAPTWAEARKEADAFFNLRTVASFVLPAAPNFRSPYQPYIDYYRRLRAADPESADARFLTEVGEEYFALTQSVTRSMDGVPPTIEGYAARKKYQDLVEKHPDLGALIVGAEGAGEFSKAVYDAQLAKKLAPGAAANQREALPFEEAAVQPNVRLGWIYFTKLMDLVDAQRVERGLPNLQVKAAADLAAVKRMAIAYLAERYPEWYEDYAVTDSQRWDKRIEGMREIAADDRLTKRPDIAGLRDYLKARDLMVAELKRRREAGGAATLTATANADLRGVWESLTGDLVERNLAFGQLFHRWLERDLPRADDTTVEEAA